MGNPWDKPIQHDGWSECPTCGGRLTFGDLPGGDYGDSCKCGYAAASPFACSRDLDKTRDGRLGIGDVGTVIYEDSQFFGLVGRITAITYYPLCEQERVALRIIGFKWILCQYSCRVGCYGGTMFEAMESNSEIQSRLEGLDDVEREDWNDA